MTMRLLRLTDDGGMSRLKNTVQDCNLNFLLGSGISRPFLATLNNIETLLTELESQNVSDATKQIIRASLYYEYYKSVIGKNLDLLTGCDEAKPVLTDYAGFLNSLNLLMHHRKNAVLGKQVNLFTTNIDIFLEKVLEQERVEFNDGFSGIYDPVFDLSNYKKSYFKRSLQYDNISEIPVFNLLKLHGSVTWKLCDDQIRFSNELNNLSKITELLPDERHLVAITDDSTIQSLIDAVDDLQLHESVEAFMQAYNELSIVNPTKEKFQHTLLNRTYYELLRIYANELEKENTVLFVMGFSFEDEHIRDITLRAANSNPTLVIYIVSHSNSSATRYVELIGSENVRNNNIIVVVPPQVEVPVETDDTTDDIPDDVIELNDPIDVDEEELPDLVAEPSEPVLVDEFLYSLKEITTRIFLKLIPPKIDRKDIFK